MFGISDELWLVPRDGVVNMMVHQSDGGVGHITSMQHMEMPTFIYEQTFVEKIHSAWVSFDRRMNDDDGDPYTGRHGQKAGMILGAETMVTVGTLGWGSRFFAAKQLAWRPILKTFFLKGGTDLVGQLAVNGGELKKVDGADMISSGLLGFGTSSLFGANFDWTSERGWMYTGSNKYQSLGGWEFMIKFGAGGTSELIKLGMKPVSKTLEENKEVYDLLLTIPINYSGKMGLQYYKDQFVKQ